MGNGVAFQGGVFTVNFCFSPRPNVSFCSTTKSTTRTGPAHQKNPITQTLARAIGTLQLVGLSSTWWEAEPLQTAQAQRGEVSGDALYFCTHPMLSTYTTMKAPKIIIHTLDILQSIR